MAPAEPFTFGIPLMPRSAACDWRRVEALLGLTIASVRGQADGGFRVIVAGHDRPRTMPRDGRFEFLEGDWPVEEQEERNHDCGRKKHAIRQAVLDEGGGLLMFLDADDWVDARLVEAARQTIGPGDVGGFVGSGFAVDFATLRAAPLPHGRVFGRGFDRVCGSSVVVRLRPEERDPLRRDPWSLADSHHEWREAAARHGGGAARLPVAGAYLVNTAENHSERHGPFADWRRQLTEAVNRHGRPLDARLARRFGLRLAEVRRASQRCRWPKGAMYSSPLRGEVGQATSGVPDVATKVGKSGTPDLPAAG